jgi:hypothetical protein
MPSGNLEIGTVGAANGNRGGRPKGSLSAASREARDFAARVICDPEYRANVLERARTGQLGAFETTLWSYAAGKPPASLTVHVEHGPAEDLAALSNEELAERAKFLADACALLASAPAALPVIDVAAQSEPEAKRPVRSERNEREELVRLLAEQAVAEARDATVTGEAAGAP